MSSEDTLHEKEISLISEIFAKAGILTTTRVQLPKKGSKKLFCDIDVLGAYQNILLLVECVGEGKIGEKIKDFNSETEIATGDFDFLKASIKKAKRKFYTTVSSAFEELKGKLVIKRLVVASEKEDVEEERKLWQGKLFVWGKEEIEYFKVIADTTYEHCKFEIFNSLEIAPSQLTVEKHRKPRSTSFIATGEEDQEKYVVTFPVPVNDLLERSFVLRFDYDSEKGFQRLLDKAKLRRMREYLLEERKSYPNSIIVVTHPEVKISRFSSQNFSSSLDDDVKELGKETLFLVMVPDRYDAFTIIDGQHRLYSFSQDCYHRFEVDKKHTLRQLKNGDAQIKKLASELQLVVTAIYFKKPNGDISDFSGKLFFEINTKQTRIKPEDIINLTTRLNSDDPVSKANLLLGRFNEKGPLQTMIKAKYWQQGRIKITSLIKYGGIKDIFNEKSKTHKIFVSLFKKQRRIKDFSDFCLVIIDNYLFALQDLLTEKYGEKCREMWADVNLQKYYVTSAVFIGALLRLLRHFLSEKDEVYQIHGKITNAVLERELQKNIRNQKLVRLFKKPMKIVVNSFTFDLDEFKKLNYGSNRWATMEAKLFHAIRKSHKGKNFGDIKLLKKSFRSGE